MVKRMLIDATHPEETRVVVVNGTRLEELDVETSTKKQIKGNIYLAKVIRVEPSLQAAFVDYGGNRHGFLAFSEIHPDYFQIPAADRQALLDAQRADVQEIAAENARREAARQARAEIAVQTVHQDAPNLETAPVLDDAQNSGNSPNSGNSENQTESVADAAPQIASDSPFDVIPSEQPVFNGGFAPQIDDQPVLVGNPWPMLLPDLVPTPVLVQPNVSAVDVQASFDGETSEDVAVTDDAFVQAEQTNDAAEPVKAPADLMLDEPSDQELERRRARLLRNYKIQDVIKRRQIMLVQVVKEERGSKGAALTTYLSLAGRYCVLMPNTARGGGVSRKITSTTDRRRLKTIASELECPDGMAVIVRTAGSERSRTEIRRDYEYLLRAWESVRDLTLRSVSPACVYEEASLIKRSIRDLYTRDIDEVLVDGDEGYRLAKDYMRMLTPSHAKKVQPYKDPIMPMFQRYQVEAQLDAMHSPVVQLRSGGYIVIGQTEALVAIDVNSGRATKERHIEETAVKTNLEAADEIARQLRLRDLAGLIVIDFIDMEEGRNNNAVERRLKEALKSDRARIQVGKISSFGLLELSRQRLRPSLQETSFSPCPHCAGTGMIRSVESSAMHVLRAIEEEGIRRRTAELTVHVSTEIALYILNHKRDALAAIEERYQFDVYLSADNSLIAPNIRMERVRAELRPEEPPRPLAITTDIPLPPLVDDGEADEDEDDGVEEEDAAAAENGDTEVDADGNRRRRRRRRRKRKGGQDGVNGLDQVADSDGNLSDSEEGEEAEDAESDAESESDADGDTDADTEDGDDESASDRRKRRRGRRGGRRRRGRGRENEANGDSDANGEALAADGEDMPAASDSFGDGEVSSEPVVSDQPPLFTETQAFVSQPQDPSPASEMTAALVADPMQAGDAETIRTEITSPMVSASQLTLLPDENAAVEADDDAKPVKRTRTRRKDPTLMAEGEDASADAAPVKRTRGRKKTEANSADLSLESAGLSGADEEKSVKRRSRKVAEDGLETSDDASPKKRTRRKPKAEETVEESAPNSADTSDTDTVNSVIENAPVSHFVPDNVPTQPDAVLDLAAPAVDPDANPVVTPSEDLAPDQPASPPRRGWWSKG